MPAQNYICKGRNVFRNSNPICLIFLIELSIRCHRSILIQRLPYYCLYLLSDIRNNLWTSRRNAMGFQNQYKSKFPYGPVSPL